MAAIGTNSFSDSQLVEYIHLISLHAEHGAESSVPKRFTARCTITARASGVAGSWSAFALQCMNKYHKASMSVGWELLCTVLAYTVSQCVAYMVEEMCSMQGVLRTGFTEGDTVLLYWGDSVTDKNAPDP